MGFLFIGIQLISYETRELLHLCFKEIAKLIESKKMQPFCFVYFNKYPYLGNN